MSVCVRVGVKECTLSREGDVMIMESTVGNGSGRNEPGPDYIITAAQWKEINNYSEKSEAAVGRELKEGDDHVMLTFACWPRKKQGNIGLKSLCE